MQPDSTRILFTADLPPELRGYFAEQLQGLHGVSLIHPPDYEDATLMELAPDAAVIIGWRCPTELLEAAENLELWIFPGVGVQRLIEPFKQANQQRSVVLANCHGNTYATAQHAVALLLAALSKVIPHDRWMREGQWRKGDGDAVSVTLRNRRIGLLGYGGVNSKVHRFLSGFDVEFAVLRRHWEKETRPGNLRTIQRYNPDQLGRFMSHCDVVMAALPETPQTTGMIGGDELQQLGETGFIVNVGRGSLIDESALFHALQDGVIAGAGIDVWYDYRPEPDAAGRKFPSRHPFHELENVVLSPHRAASPIYDPSRWDEVIEIVRRFVSGGELINVVDLQEGY